ncbi:MAG TPA: PKD domain-containing protein [Bacteroidia bacterium]|nr:PKD domain-containing protein [Bacteroidia bacterium]
MKNLLFALSCFAFFAGCRKDDPARNDGTPVFYVNGTLDGQPLSLKAGVNDYYMYSSCPSDTNGLYEYTGQLKQQGCTSSVCPSSLTVRINDYATHAPLPTSPDSALRPGNYNFLSSQPPSYAVQFHPVLQAGDSIISCTWSFGSNATDPVHTFPSGGSYFVTLTANITHNFFSGTSVASDSVYVTPPSPCMTASIATSNVDQNNGTGDTVQFTSTVTGGAPPYFYSWDFGDSNTGSVSNPLHSYANPGPYAVRLSVTDNNGCSTWKELNVATPHSDSSVVNFTWQQLSSASLFSAVTIEWTDASGTVYSSAGGTQPGSSSFQLISEDEYQPNENNEPTKKIHFLVTCTLFNGANSLLLQNADIVFAVSHH